MCLDKFSLFKCWITSNSRFKCLYLNANTDGIEFIYQVHYSENNFINDDNKSHLIKSLGIVSV